MELSIGQFIEVSHANDQEKEVAVLFLKEALTVDAIECIQPADLEKVVRAL